MIGLAVIIFVIAAMVYIWASPVAAAVAIDHRRWDMLAWVIGGLGFVRWMLP